MFSLCIPTINRYDTFLIKNLPRYLENKYIDEIIITDENGNDYEKLVKNFNNDKLKVFKNEIKLGPFLNKLKCCKLAKNEWIVLMDSDNFADIDYFEIAYNFIKNNNLKKETILAPSFAKPRFDYRKLSNCILNKKTAKDIFLKDKILTTCINTGNYVINKYLVENINIEKELNNIPFSSACDVVYFNLLLFEQFDLNFYIVENLSYEHVVHEGSIYLQTHSKPNEYNFAHYINQKFINFCN